jgi:N-acetylmuramoyl-L-alanine amidase/putative methionine-R-sulfoxide reductase with GAF domain
MITSPNNPGLESIEGNLTPVSARVPLAQPPNGGREALQALLAFSALHEQIRQHRSHDDGEPREDPWQLEQFVLDEVLQLVAERALAITGADGVAIALAEGDAIVCHAAAGNISPDCGARLDPNAGFSGACLVSNRIVRCDDSEVDPRVDALACRRLGARSMLAVPLSARQTVVGLIEAFSAEPYGFTDSDVRILSLLAELILSALKPEEEDRLAEISHRVVGDAALQSEIPELREDLPAPVAEADSGDQLPDNDPLPAPIPDYESVENSRPGLGVVIALTAFAFLLGAGLWWGIRRHAGAPAEHPQLAANSVAISQPQATNASAPPAIEPADLSQDETSLAPASAAKIGTLPEVTGLRHWASADSSTVVIDLQDQVQYEAHRLTKPERIYFDLHDTRLANALSAKTIDVGDPLLQKIRVAQPVPGITRVVLETIGASNFSVSLEQNPYRLVVEVRKIGAKPQDRTKVDLFGPGSEMPSMQNAATTPLPDMTTAPQLRAGGPKLRIVLDAGHGGWDLGTVGRNGLLEKNLALDIVARLGKLAEKRLGAEIVYTRTGDDYVALEKRAEIANLAHADLFMSVHANYSDFPSARGVETYYTNTYSSVRARPHVAGEDVAGPRNVDWTKVDIREKVQESRRLAASVQHSLYGELETKNPGLRNRGVKKAEYVVLTGTSMPAILAEVSFVSSPTDENNLQSSSYRQSIAEALYRGLALYEKESAVKMASAR